MTCRYRSALLSVALSVAFICLAGCSSDVGRFSASVIKRTILPDIPSGSAILFYRDSLLIIGDDATALYRLALPNHWYHKYPIAVTDSAVARTVKDEKLDLEAAVAYSIDGKNYLLAFGSGSIAGKRDSLLAAPLDDLSSQQFYTLQKLYQFLRWETHTPPAAWNIEAAAISGEYLILFNRGTNAMMKLKRTEFGNFLRHHVMPRVSVHLLELPVFQGHTPGISGACTLENGDLLFCASLEATPNWYEDGSILGSYIGIIDPEKNEISHIVPVTDRSGSRLKVKLESLAVTGETDEVLKVAAVADNDNGTTQLLQLEIRF